MMKKKQKEDKEEVLKDGRQEKVWSHKLLEKYINRIAPSQPDTCYPEIVSTLMNTIHGDEMEVELH